MFSILYVGMSGDNSNIRSTSVNNLAVIIEIHLRVYLLSRGGVLTLEKQLNYISQLDNRSPYMIRDIMYCAETVFHADRENIDAMNIITWL